MDEPYNPGRVFKINPEGYKTKIRLPNQESLDHGKAVRKIADIEQCKKDSNEIKEVWE